MNFYHLRERVVREKNNNKRKTKKQELFDLSSNGIRKIVFAWSLFAIFTVEKYNDNKKVSPASTPANLP